jgi:signal transduction histidine kinase
MIAGRGPEFSGTWFWPRARWRTAAAGLLQVLGLSVALSGGSAIPAVGLGASGALVTVWALAPQALRAMSRHRGWIVFALGMLVVAWWAAVVVARIVRTDLFPLSNSMPGPFEHIPAHPVLGRGPLLGAALLTAGGGLVLIADAVRVWLGLAPLQLAPWKQMTETPERAEGLAWRAVAGMLLVALAAVLAIGFAGPYVAGSPALQVVVLLVVATGAAVLAGTPLIVGAFMRLDRDRAGSARERERQRFAAHLHDSVLQTLALVQRQAHDPAAVARLARRQEHALRAWMAGQAELASETVVAALRDAVAGVEDAHGITVEMTAIGDRPLDAAGEALVAAAREALRNAGCHAEGAPVFVFTQASAERLEVFIRDEGPGFDANAVPVERRGIRDAIIGRMASAGGRATIDAVPGEGTEVALCIDRTRLDEPPAPALGRRRPSPVTGGRPS